MMTIKLFLGYWSYCGAGEMLDLVVVMIQLFLVIELWMGGFMVVTPAIIDDVEAVPACKSFVFASSRAGDKRPCTSSFTIAILKVKWPQ